MSFLSLHFGISVGLQPHEKDHNKGGFSPEIFFEGLRPMELCAGFDVSLAIALGADV